MTDTPTLHQIKIALDTLRMSDIGATIMGGMSKEKAREILREKAGWSQQRVDAYENK